MEQGTGKSLVIIATFTHLFLEKKIDAVLILAPNGVHDNWNRVEIPAHCSLFEDSYEKAVWHGTDGVRKRNHWNSVVEGEPGKLSILMANIEAARTTAFKDSLQQLLKRRFLLVIDESTVIKNPKAEQSRAVHKLADFASYSRILTGTPITQGPLDFWSQCRALNGSALPYPSYTAYKHEFAVEELVYMGPNRPQFLKVVGYKNIEVLKAHIARFSTRILKKECLDLPEKIYTKRYIDLTPEQKRIYKDLSEKCIAQLGNGQQVSVTMALTAMLRLQQVALGYVTDDIGSMKMIPSNRINALVETLEENPVKTIIFCRFKEDILRIKETLGDALRYVEYHGDIEEKERSGAIDAFQRDEGVRLFIATDAAARGLTLTAAEHVVYYSQGFSLEKRLQSEDRAHRIGQKKNVLYTDFVSRGTVDEKIVQALLLKQEMADKILSRQEFVKLVQLED